jgi:CRP-like cAMP-binding protein
MPHPGREENRILALLPQEDFDRLAPHLERWHIPLGEVVCEPDQPMQYGYFPISNVLSSVIVLRDGAAVESAVIGNEGMAGLGLLAEDNSSPYRLVQQVEGDGLRIPADVLKAALDESETFRRIVERYVLALLRQSAQNTACGRHHSVEERMCRWLLTTADRVKGDEFYITQEFLGEMLGVRRQSVNLTAGQLQEAGLISYRRGRLKILDRARLEESACECYRLTRNAYERLMRTPATS